jgi:GNAT superfamily N-acetyltransferase
VTKPHRVDPDAYEISTDKSRLDLDRISAFLADSYWASKRPRHVIEKSIAASLCFAAYRKADGAQVGFARVVTDGATFGWLADVYVDPECRGAGLGKALMQAITQAPELRGVRLLLVTRDAHGLYARYGFEALSSPQDWMFRTGQP